MIVKNIKNVVTSKNRRCCDASKYTCKLGTYIIKGWILNLCSGGHEETHGRRNKGKNIPNSLLASWRDVVNFVPKPRTSLVST